jgi:5-methylthioribose kinase
MGGEDFRQMAKRFSNKELCGLTEQVIFTDPYYQAKNNKHTSPQLDAIVAEIQSNDALKAEATRMKAVFLSKQEALVHGDFHTGSLMVTEDSTFVIDPEFAFVGPIAFDVGKFIANLLMTYFAADGLSRQDGRDRTQQKAWLLSIIEYIWKGFKEEFISQWNESIPSTTEGLCHKLVFTSDKGLQALQGHFFRDVWTEVVGFAGCVIIRRILGVAHVADFETISNPDDRAACETHALTLAQKLLLDRECLTFKDITDITQAASKIA